MRNNFLGRRDSLFRKDNAQLESFQNDEKNSKESNSQNLESNSSLQNSTAKTMQYVDEPTLNDNVLREMAGAYAKVLSKYGYFMKKEDNHKTEIAKETFRPTSPQPLLQPQQQFQPQPFQQLPSQQQQPLGTFESNLDYLSQNLLNVPPMPTIPPTVYIDNQAIASSLQTTNNLLQQILDELKTIACILENNRRRRLS